MTTRKSAFALLVWLIPGLALSAAVLLPETGMRAASGSQFARADQTAGAPQQAKPPAPQTPGRGSQRPQGPFEWWKDEGVKKELGLTEQVAREIDRIYQEREKAVAPFVAERDKAHDELDAMMAARIVEPEVIAIQAARFENLSARIRESRTVMLYKMHRKLTLEQSKKLQTVFDRMRNGRGGGRGPR